MIIGSSKNMLEDIVRDTKSFTSTTLNTAIKEHLHERRKEWMLWLLERAGKKNGNNNDWSRTIREQQHNKPLEIISQEMFDEKLAYIHQNPVQAGFVTKEEDWKYTVITMHTYRDKGLID